MHTWLSVCIRRYQLFVIGTCLFSIVMRANNLLLTLNLSIIQALYVVVL